MQISYAVLDSGILLATVQTETYTQQAKALLADLDQSRVQLVAPILQKYELVSVVRKWVHRGVITPQDAQPILTTVLNYPVALYFDNALIQRSYELAVLYNQPATYDSQYLALAERLSCDFWTTDERLFNAVQTGFPNIHWLGNWRITP